MALVSFKNFYFKYNEKDKNILSNINLDVLPGEFILICGPSGSGKTTLLTNLKKEIRPAGIYDGKIYYDNKDMEILEDKKSAGEIGFLFQNPEDQFVSDNVIQEIAFPLENIGLPSEDIRNRIAEMAAFFGLENYLYKNVTELSGGQKQLVNLCSLLVLKPKLLLLDEPTSQLDPIAAHNFLSMLRRLNEEFSITIMATEHRIDNIFPFADKTVFLEDGHIEYIDKPRTVCSKACQNPVFCNYLPSVARVHLLLQSKYPFLNKCKIPLNIREGMQELDLLDKKLKESGTALSRDKNENIVKNSNDSNKGDILLKCKDVWFGYINDHLILRGVFIDIKKGEFISIFGGNGTGKTTLLQILSGIIKPQKGKINLKKGIKVGYVHQNPMVHFWKDTVQEELSLNFLEKLEDNESSKFRKLRKYMSQNKQDPIKSKNNQMILDSQREELIKLFGISHLLDKHPYDCSGGEKQKIAIIKALLNKPDILFLDEPTKGLDPVSKLHLAHKLKKLQENGLTIVMATHDIDFAAEHSQRCMILFDGKIQIDSTPKAVFSSNNFYTTFVNRMVKNFLPESITLDDVKENWIG